MHIIHDKFKCSGCDLNFSNETHLLTHARTHIGDKATQCTICENIFSYKCALLDHKRTNTSENCENRIIEVKRINDQNNKEKIAKARSENKANETEKDRFIHFKKDLKDCWSVGCLCCHRKMSTTSGRYYDGDIDKLKADLENKERGLFDKCILTPIPRELYIDQKLFLCTTCDRYLRQKKEMPPLCYFNGLEVDKIPKELELNDLEATLVSKRILFLKIYHLPKSRWNAVKDQTVNVPICDNTLLKTLNKLAPLPRQPGDAGLICVKLKRKMEYKNTHIKAYIQGEKLVEAVIKLKELGHPGYYNIPVNNRFSILNDEEEEDEDSEQTINNQEEVSDIEETDSIRRNQFDLRGATTMTESYPEASVVHRNANCRNKESQADVSIAPGEGKIPTDLMRDETFDVDGFPHLHPTGKFGLNHHRNKKLSKQQYFLQRLQNIDKRWSQNSAYLFATLYCLERESLERQINISYRRGKVVQGSLQHLEDAFSVFDNVPGTVRYWQQTI